MSSVLDKIACLQGRRDEAPNQVLARELAETGNQEGIREIAENLSNRDKDIRFDCIKVLYEIGYLKPELIAGYAADFLKLLKSKENRMVWGGMLALSTVAELKGGELYPHLADIQKAMEKGSVITVDNGVKVLAAIASQNEAYRQVILPYLLQHLATCRPKDVPQHAEKSLMAVNGENKEEFIQVLEQRMDNMSASQASRLRKVIRMTNQLPDKETKL